jgi:hypothetical protein
MFKESFPIVYDAPADIEKWSPRMIDRWQADRLAAEIAMRGDFLKEMKQIVLK